MSADNAVSRAQARTNSMIDAAIQGGSVAELNHKNMSVALRIGRRNVKLVGGDGVATREGTHYYGQLGIPPPAVYPYEQGLVNGKWIVGFDGKKHLVQRQTSDGKWATTKKGLDYFRYNRDEYEVEFPIRIACPEKSVSKRSSLTKIFTEEDGKVWRIANFAFPESNNISFAIVITRPLEVCSRSTCLSAISLASLSSSMRLACSSSSTWVVSRFIFISCSGFPL